MINLEKAKSVLKALEEKGLTLGSVESLTGGLFASTICSVPGASKVFKGSFITYEIPGMDRTPSLLIPPVRR